MFPTPRSEGPPLSRSGARAREQLIETAGEVFAEKGFQGATSREICLRAGVSQAAVNYHFGGFEALCTATLKEAHRSAIWIGPLDVEGFDEMSTRQKLSAVVSNLVERLSQSTSNCWEMRLVSRELVIPTFAQADFVATSIEPRRAFIRSILADIIGQPADHPQVGRYMLTVIAFCIIMSIISRPTLETFLLDLDGPADCVKLLIDHVERFVMAGLDGVVQASATSGASSSINIEGATRRAARPANGR